MSIYSSSESWGCPSVNQSPINLSQSSAEPCDLLCELVMDEVMISEASVYVSDEGLILQNSAGLGTCKFNGDGYTCNLLLVNHPSHHTIETIQADGEVIAVFQNPNKPFLCVSSLFRVNSNQTASSKFFNAFIPYSNTELPSNKVNLGGEWSLNMMVPPTGSYFSYTGSMVMKPCNPAQWVVFKSMINMDPTVFAYLVKTVSPGSRPIQGLGNRKVFFNNIERVPGAPSANDNKLYIRLRKVGGNEGGAAAKASTVTAAPVKEKVDEKNSTTNSIVKSIQDEIDRNGVIAWIDVLILLVSVGIGIYYGMDEKNRFIGRLIMNKAEPAADFIMSILSTMYSYVRVFFMFFIGFFRRPKDSAANDEY